MPVRIYDIAKKLGIESKQVLAIAKELGIKEAKVPSSSLDKITAEFLEEKLGPLKPAAPAPVVEAPAPLVIIKAPEPEPPPAPAPEAVAPV
ncbi:MAG: Translation initiation factor IF-2, partial [Limisphaerales bacterium]